LLHVSPVAFRKADIQTVVDRGEVGDHVIRIIEDKSTLEQSIAGHTVASGDVRECIAKWHAPWEIRTFESNKIAQKGLALSGKESIAVRRT
jgi:hypothetical protein